MSEQSNDPLGDGETVYATEPRAKPEGSGGKEKHNDKNWLYVQYHHLKKSTQEIADQCSVSRSTITRRMDEFDIERRDTSEALQIKRGYSKLGDGEWLREKYVEEELTGIEIAEEIGCMTKQVYKWLDKHGIPRRDESHSQNVRKKYTDPDWLFEEHHAKGRTLKDMADECGVSRETLWRWMKRFEIPSKGACEVNIELTQEEMEVPVREGELPGSIQDGALNMSQRALSERTYKGTFVPYRNPEWLRQKWVGEDLTDTEIAELCECNPETIRNWRVRFDITGHSGEDHHMTTLSESDVATIRERYAEGETYKEIVEDYNLTVSGASQIVRGKTWADAPGPIKKTDGS